MKNILKNKKGFTLLEILVTVGIVAVLSAVAIPAYNQYKKGTIETAVESDIGNFQKAYMAYNAVYGTYCATFDTAGIKLVDKRNYAQGGAIGFADVGGGCGGTPTVADVQEIPESGSCDDPSKTSSADCTGNWDDDNDANTPDVSRNWSGNTKGQIADCELSIDQLVMGATTKVSGIEKAWAVNEEGKIREGDNTDVTVTCPTSANFDSVSHTF